MESHLASDGHVLAIGAELIAGFAGSSDWLTHSGVAAGEAELVFNVSVFYIYKAPIRRRLTVDIIANPFRGRPPRKLSPEQ